MDILIDNNKKLISIQNEFQKRFPFLKIEFYKDRHEQGEGSPIENTLNNELQIGEVRKSNSSGTIKITGLMKVAELEAAFANTFGLAVQIFRKSDTIWLQTSTTDSWTLAEQNQKAMEMEKQVESKVTIPDSMDTQELE